MKIDLFDINEFIKVNRCQEITNPSPFNFDKTPTTDGLFSYEIFGMSEYKRKTTYAYIKLPRKFIHPALFTIMMSRMGNIKKILSGDIKAKVDSRGNIIYIKPGEEGYDKALTGIDFFYENIYKKPNIKWNAKFIESDDEDGTKSDSIDKKARLDLFRKVPKDEFFIDKWLVLPPFYRDTNPEMQTLGDNINKLYKELIMKCSGGSTYDMFNLFGASNDFQIQMKLYDIYQDCIKPLTGKSMDPKNPRADRVGSAKNSMMRQNVLGKTIDYSAANVIISNDIGKVNNFSDFKVKYGYGGFPLITAMTTFHPFVLNSIVQFLETTLLTHQASKKEIKKIDTKQFDTKKAEKLIKRFIKSPELRDNPIEYEYTDNNGDKKISYIPLYINHKKDFSDTRQIYMTYLMLMYIVTEEAVQGKHAYATRHPVTNFQNIFPQKIHILTTDKTQKTWIRVSEDQSLNQAVYYNDFPMVRIVEKGKRPKQDSRYDLIDAYMPGNIYLDALNGDFDGDVLFIKGLFTKEANEEADKLINSLTQVLGTDGTPSRTITSKGGDQVICLYQLTKDVPL